MYHDSINFTVVLFPNEFPNEMVLLALRIDFYEFQRDFG